MPINLDGRHYHLSEVRIFNIDQDDTRANFTAIVKDDTGNVIAKEVLVFTDRSYVDFWKNFNSGNFLYKKLAQKLGHDIPELQELEQDFFPSVNNLLEDSPVQGKIKVSYVKTKNAVLSAIGSLVLGGLISYLILTFGVK